MVWVSRLPHKGRLFVAVQQIVTGCSCVLDTVANFERVEGKVNMDEGASIVEAVKESFIDM